MAVQSFFGTAAPAGSWTDGNDGVGGIVTGTGFYFTSGSPAIGMNIVGAKAWLPAGHAGDVYEFGLWIGANVAVGAGWGVDLAGTPLRTQSVTITDNTAHWESVTWSTPYSSIVTGRMYGSSIKNTTTNTRYHFGINVRPTTPMPTETPNIDNMWWSEGTAGGPQGYAGGFFRMGTSATQLIFADTSSYYASDLLIDISAGNVTPTANAGSDQTVTAGTLVTLNGSGSSDPDGTISTYTWTQVSGTTVTLSGSGASRTFTPATSGTRVFGLTVTDNLGATSTQDQVTITVNASGGGNVAPTANAGVDQSVDTGTVVTLNGSASSDSDGTIASYAWAQISGTSVTLSGTGATRTFTPTVAGTYVFGLTVTDDDGDSSAQDTISIVASAPSGVLTVAQENALTPSQNRTFWLDGVTVEAMPAFPRSTYYLPGQTAQFSINYNLPFNFDVFRLGHYGGNGARRVATAVAGTPTAQPAAAVIANSNGAVTCAAWSVNASWSVPLDATPGWYVAVLKGTNGTDFGSILFTVSDKNNKRLTLIVGSDATWHAAYNGYGGNNVYGASTSVGSAGARALCSTYDKPVITQDNVPQTHFYNNTYPYLKWSESVGVNAGVTTIEQIKNDPTILDGRSLIIWTGHNEYIPQQVMTKTKALLTAGQNMVNIAGNDFFWRVKFTNGDFSSATNGRVMWCKKDTLDGPSAIRSGGGGTPFTTEADWTGTWQDTRWSLREPSYEFFGDQFIANGIRADAVTVPSAMKGMPPWRNCAGVQALGIGQSYTFTAGSLGMEWDEPHASTTLDYVTFSSTDIALTANASDENGQNYNVTTTGNHRFMMMKSGNSYVANFNSDQWPWALDSLHLRGSAASDVNARQMMLNVLYDLGVTGNNTNILATGLTVPVAVSNFALSYGLPALADPPPTGGGGSFLTVLDTPTLNLTITGDGSSATPYVISGVASPELGYSQSTQMFYSDGTQWHEL
jgi:hypothetical protein